MDINLYEGDSLEVLKQMNENSVDSIVTDPPYGFSFMGNKWDYDVPSVEIWQQCLRVLKPGGHLLSFSGSRTYHRMVVNIEDAGFEIRDQIMWLYGAGFPKSRNIGKDVDKKLGNDRKVVANSDNGIAGGSGEFVKGNEKTTGFKKTFKVTQGDSDWEGWGTCLKPAHEPIVMARKPVTEKTIVDNVLKYRTGAINIDDSRIGYTSDNDKKEAEKLEDSFKEKSFDTGRYNFNVGHSFTRNEFKAHPKGRFPSNVMFECICNDAYLDKEKLDKIKGYKNEKQSVMGWGTKKPVADKQETLYVVHTNKDCPAKLLEQQNTKASRFFYCAKVSKTDRNEGLEQLPTKQSIGGGGTNNTEDDVCGKFGSVKSPSKNYHPTVKPTPLMQYLVKLVTPKNGTVLDPFMGSGSTGKACAKENMNFIGIDLSEEYIEIAKKRIENVGN